MGVSVRECACAHVCVCVCTSAAAGGRTHLWLLPTRRPASTLRLGDTASLPVTVTRLGIFCEFWHLQTATQPTPHPRDSLVPLPSGVLPSPQPHLSPEFCLIAVM